MSRILYLDLGMGAAGDMISGALFSLFDESEQVEILDALNGMGLEGVRIEKEDVKRSGIRGVQLHVHVRTRDGEEAEEGHDHRHHHEADRTESGHLHEQEPAHTHHHHAHASLGDILSQVDSLMLPDSARENIRWVYRKIAEAESRVHGEKVTEIHFHEVGAKDAIMDIAAAAYMISLLAPDRIIASPIRTGYGTVRCAHGILPVPAPATALLLQGIPAFAGDIEGEMCTPTGAALAGGFAGEFCPMPEMTIERIGYGMGTKKFETLNCVRAVLGTSVLPDVHEEMQHYHAVHGEGPGQPGEAVHGAGTEKPEDRAPGSAVEQSGDGTPGLTGTQRGPAGSMVELSCNLDDCTGEEMGFALERVREAGAVEAFCTPVFMKKGRPGYLLTALTDPSHETGVVQAIFRHTTTIGIRRIEVSRYTLERETVTRETPYGTVRVKKSTGWGVTKEKAEYEDLARLAREQNVSVREAAKIFRQ